MRYIKYIVIVLGCLSGAVSLSAQDIHFSDYFASPLNLNPALAGLFPGTLRATGIYRDQYRTVSVPYQTIGLGVDILNRKLLKQNPMLGYGLQINYDVAGDTRFSSTQFIVPVALHFPFYKEKLIISLGLSPGMHFYAINQSGMSLPNQFIDDRFDASLPVDDNFSRLSTRVFNLGAGFNIKIYPKVKYSISFGFALHNVTQPTLSFFDKSSNNSLPRRMVAHTQWRRRVASHIDLVPELRWQMQSTQQEWQMGLKAVHSIDNIVIPFYEYGIAFRARSLDAVIAHVGCTYRDYVVSLNYDVNLSKLRPASNYHGAFEISVLYIYNRANHMRKTKFIKCPTHI